MFFIDIEAVILIQGKNIFLLRTELFLWNQLTGTPRLPQEKWLNLPFFLFYFLSSYPNFNKIQIPITLHSSLFPAPFLFTLTRNFPVAPSLLCVHIHYLFWFRKIPISVETYQLYFCVLFCCAFHLKISSLFIVSLSFFLLLPWWLLLETFSWRHLYRVITYTIYSDLERSP